MDALYGILNWPESNFDENKISSKDSEIFPLSLIYLSTFSGYTPS